MNPSYELEISPGAPRRLSTAWLALAVSALALSTVFALSLSIARTPFVGALLPGVDLYRTALVLHVDLAVLILFLAHAALLWTAISAGGSARLQWIAVACAGAGTVAMVVSPFVASGAAVMSNYVPMLDNPVFEVGMGGFALALLLAGAVALWRGRPGLAAPDAQSALRWGIYLSILPMLMAIVSLGWMALELPALARDEYFEKLLWGPGHLMQFSYVLVMMVSWLILAAASKVPVPLSPRSVWWCFTLTTAPVLLAPLLHLALPAQSAELRDAYTGLMAFALWPAAAWLGLTLLASALRVQRAVGVYDSARASLMLSVTLFVFGCIAGAAISSNNVMITGHYHGTVGAVALALMGIAFHLLPQLGYALPQSRLARWQPVVYGAGLLLMALGLVWSGLYNVQRKVPGSGLLSADPSTLLTLAVVGAGGLIAFVGMLGCALPVLSSLLRGTPGGTTTRRRKDTRLRSLAIVLVCVVLGGAIIAGWSGHDAGDTVPLATQAAVDPRPASGKPADQARRAEIDLRFQQGVVMLHAKQYEYALASFKRVIELSPNMPEAHVNMGFTLLGLKQYKLAADFFDSATVLRPEQINAYWGLAQCLEASGNLRGAIEAMEAFVHLSKPEHPFRSKGAEVIAAWEAKQQAQYAAQEAGAKKRAAAGKGTAKSSAADPASEKLQ